MSLTPGNDAWEALQERLGQKKQRVVIWRNPVLYRYAAAAACLILVALFGWLYWPAETNMQVQHQQVAVSTQKPVQSTKKQESEKSEQPEQNLPSTQTNAQTERPVEQLADVRKPGRSANFNKSKASVTSSPNDNLEKVQRSEEPIIAKSEPVKAPVEQPTTVSSEPVVAAAKPAPTADRVLVVTIAEPDALIAARQAAQETEEKVVVMNPEETKRKGVKKLLDQLQRVKQGEVAVAKRDNEQGTLLGWAYRGIKQSFEKDKSDK
ncbi:hypothetical protein [Fibrisoma limi]|nr:hypothetical protein [Fibrisoma limi]